MSRLLSKWNYRKHEYEPYQIPDSWDVEFNSGDMERVVSCAGCGKKIKVGDSFCSMSIHTKVFGFSYLVCGDCMKADIKERRKVIVEETERSQMVRMNGLFSAELDGIGPKGEDDDQDMPEMQKEICESAGTEP